MRFHKNQKTFLRFVSLFMFVCWVSVLAKAHNGPPFPIVTDKQIGTVKISVWTHPDIGTGTFFVLVDPLPGTAVPNDLKIDLGIQPTSNRLTEVIYPMQRDNGRGEVRYNAQVEFDKQDFFKVRVHVQSSAGSGEAISQVEATPAGFGRWDLLFYLSPFLLVAAMFYHGVRKKRKKLMQQMNAEGRAAS
ncbi:MAG TPA: hypothetical protein VLK33_13375 [Terriglobales bacterium]|nr:hypothetical protein [Terriglobales bacterium]